MKALPILLFFPILISCQHFNQKNYDKPQKVIIAGKVQNVDLGYHEVKLYINKAGFSQTSMIANSNITGTFHATFESYTPTDFILTYKGSMLFVLAHPGDSMYIEFDGSTENRIEFLETIKFSGDASKTNQDASIFQAHYNSSFSDEWKALDNAKKSYTPEKFLLYLDTLKGKADHMYNTFVKEVSPNRETKIWAKTRLESYYYDALISYPGEYTQANFDYQTFRLPGNYYKPLFNYLPIKQEKLISGSALSVFINRFNGYCNKRIWNDPKNQKYTSPEVREEIPREKLDSLFVHGIITHTPDPLLRQLALTEFVSQHFDQSDIGMYEKFRPVFDDYIKVPFLAKPLAEKYAELKAGTHINIYTPVKKERKHLAIAPDAHLEKFEDLSGKQAFDSILTKNKDKVVYVDFWATWCGPCKEEMPHSKTLMEDLKGNEVAFVYLCIDCAEKLWKEDIAEFQIGGQHYYLTKKQSDEIKKAFEIQGIPYYLLVDKDGEIVDKGHHLKPYNMRSQILKLL